VRIEILIESRKVTARVADPDNLRGSGSATVPTSVPAALHERCTSVPRAALRGRDGARHLRAMIELRLLGTIDLRSGDHPEAASLLSRPSPTALLAYLASAPRSSFLRRDSLLTLFWPETSQAQARANLRKLVHTIRASLGPECIEARGDEELRIAASALWCDAAEFQSAMRGDQIERAMELYAGPLMPGFYLDGGGQFSRWLDDTRGQLARDAAKAALKLAEQHLRAAQRTQASDLAQFIGRIGADLDDEYLFRKLLDLLVRLGDHATALRMFEQFSARIDDEYGGVPAPQTRELIASIRSR